VELLCERIKRLREERKLYRCELAERMNVSTVTITYWESGRSNPLRDRIPGLARLLGVTTDYLLSGREAPRLAAIEQAILSSPTPDERLVGMVRRQPGEIPE
jgi:transcriptional regulator with XRE-family HTH domain